MAGNYNSLSAAAKAFRDSYASRMLSIAGVVLTEAQLYAVGVLCEGAVLLGGNAKFGAIWPLIGGTAAAHSLNLLSTSFGLTWVGSVTHNASGVTGDGATGYADTGYNPGASNTSSLHLGSYTVGSPGAGVSRYELGNGTVLVGANSTLLGWHSTGANEGGVIAYGGVEGVAGAVAPYQDGSKISTVNGSRVCRLYVRGVLSGAAPTMTGLFTAANIYLLAGNNAGAAFGHSLRRVSCAHIGLGLSATESEICSKFVTDAQITLRRNA